MKVIRSHGSVPNACPGGSFVPDWDWKNLQMYGRQEEERTQELQQQHAKCAHTLRRQAANAEPYIQVPSHTQHALCVNTSLPVLLLFSAANPDSVKCRMF